MGLGMMRQYEVYHFLYTNTTFSRSITSSLYVIGAYFNGGPSNLGLISGAGNVFFTSLGSLAWHIGVGCFHDHDSCLFVFFRFFRTGWFV